MVAKNTMIGWLKSRYYSQIVPLNRPSLMHFSCGQNHESNFAENIPYVIWLRQQRWIRLGWLLDRLLRCYVNWWY